MKQTRTLMLRNFQHSLFFLLPLWSFLLLALNLQAQTQRQYIKAGDEAFAEYNYRAAMIYYDTVYSIRPDDPEIAHKFAEAARLYKVYKLAEPAYQAVVDGEGSLQKYPLAQYWLAAVKKSQGKYEEALETFQEFLLAAPPNQEYYLERTRQEIENCRWALELMDQPLPEREVYHLDTSINTLYTEVAPYWTGERLYYSSLRFPNDQDDYVPPRPITKILMSDSLQAGVPMGDSINVPRKHTAHTAFSLDGRRIYFTVCEYEKGLKIRCGIYYREKQEDGSWGKARPVTGNINVSGASSTNPSIGYDEKRKRELLYFASDRPGGQGGMDVWYASMDKDGNPAEPVNFSYVNTPEDEITPFYDNRFRVFYFSSKAHRNLGGFDIFEVKKIGEDWGEIKNVGLPINTSYDETHFTVDKTGDFAHYASNHPDQVVHDPQDRDIRTCCSDIYNVELNRYIELEAIGQCGGDLLSEVRFNLENLSEPEGIAQAVEDTFRYRLVPEAEYRLVASKPDYKSDSLEFDTRNLEGGTVLNKELTLEARIYLTVTLNDKIDDAPINGATIELRERGELYQVEKDLEGNSFTFELQPDRTYEIVVKKQEFLSTTREVTTTRSCTPQNLQEPIPMTRLRLELPISLYFDNDRPNPRTLQKTTRRTYAQTYRAYFERKEVFKQEFSRGLEPEAADSAAMKVDSFFEVDVKTGFERLDAFADELIPYLENLEPGQTLIISIRGFASPVAGGLYNQNLTSRRIASVRNFFNAKYGGDRLQQFIDADKLQVVERSFGESEAQKDVSDDPNDDKNSIYSVKASKERRVEIIDIAREEER